MPMQCFHCKFSRQSPLIWPQQWAHLDTAEAGWGQQHFVRGKHPVSYIWKALSENCFPLFVTRGGKKNQIILTSSTFNTEWVTESSDVSRTQRWILDTVKPWCCCLSSQAIPSEESCGGGRVGWIPGAGAAHTCVIALGKHRAKPLE